LFPIICLAIDGGLTGNLRSCFGRFFFGQSGGGGSSSSNNSNISKNVSTISRREVFLGGVRFHIGIVVGCFLVWTLIDVYFKASPSILVTLALSFVVCLTLCYGMICIHDRYIAISHVHGDGQTDKNSQVNKALHIDGLLIV
jgi:hypothetical protein